MRKKIHEVSQELGLHPNTIRLLERRGLIHPDRNLAGHRVFTDDMIQEIRAIYRDKRPNNE